MTYIENKFGSSSKGVSDKQLRTLKMSAKPGPKTKLNAKYKSNASPKAVALSKVASAVKKVATVAAARSGVSYPVATAYKFPKTSLSMKGDHNAINVVGNEYWGTVNTLGNVPGGRIAIIRGTPYTFPQGRLSLIAPMYEEFRFKWFRVHYIPTVATLS